VYLGSLIHSSTQSTSDIICCSGITCTAMSSLDNHFWKSRISIPAKLKLYNTCILPIFLYRSERWAVTKVDACRIDALGQRCLRAMLGIIWHQFIRSDEVRRITKQPNITVIIQSRRLSIFEHIAGMDDDADDSNGSSTRKRPPGRPCIYWLKTVQCSKILQPCTEQSG